MESEARIPCPGGRQRSEKTAHSFGHFSATPAGTMTTTGRRLRVACTADTAHGERYKGLAHADLVGEHDARLMIQAAEDLDGGVLLAVGVLVGYSVVAQGQAGVRVPHHCWTILKASST